MSARSQTQLADNAQKTLPLPGFEPKLKREKTGVKRPHDESAYSDGESVAPPEETREPKCRKGLLSDPNSSSLPPATGGDLEGLLLTQATQSANEELPSTQDAQDDDAPQPLQRLATVRGEEKSSDAVWMSTR